MANNPECAPNHECKADKIPTHREVIVNGSVKIDDLEELSNNYKAAHKDDTTHDKRDRRLALVTTFLIAVYAVLTLWQGCSNQKAADAAKEAATSGKQALIASNRSWIEVTLAPPWDKFTKEETLNSLDTLTFPLKYTNVGKTPAKKFFMVATAEVLGEQESPSLTYPGVLTGTLNHLIYPERDFQLDAVKYSADSKEGDPNAHAEPVSPTLKREFAVGTKYIVVYARGIYSDQFGDHWFSYCTAVWPSSVPKLYHTRNCSAYNDTGDGARSDWPQMYGK